MKSLALTLVVLFGALSVAQAATQDNNKPVVEEEIIAVDATEQSTEEKKPAEAN